MTFEITSTISSGIKKPLLFAVITGKERFGTEMSEADFGPGSGHDICDFGTALLQ